MSMVITEQKTQGKCALLRSRGCIQIGIKPGGRTITEIADLSGASWTAVASDQRDTAFGLIVDYHGKAVSPLIALPPQSKTSRVFQSSWKTRVFTRLGVTMRAVAWRSVTDRMLRDCIAADAND